MPHAVPCYDKENEAKESVSVLFFVINKFYKSMNKQKHTYTVRKMIIILSKSEKMKEEHWQNEQVI